MAGNGQGVRLQDPLGRSVAHHHRDFPPVGEDLKFAIRPVHHVVVDLDAVAGEQAGWKGEGETVFNLQLLSHKGLPGQVGPDAHLPVDVDHPVGVDAAGVCQRLGALKGMEVVLPRAEAAARFELPADRIGDVVAVSERFTVIGTSRSRHDLSALDAPLRSHGGISEQRVPLVVNRALAGLDASRRFRNFDAFELVLNHVGH